MVAVSPMNETLLVFGLTNFLGLINFLVNVPNPLISTLSSRATDSPMDSMMVSIAVDIWDFVISGNSFLRDFSMSERV